VQEGRVLATWSILAREVTRLPEAATGVPLEVLFAEHLGATVRVQQGGSPCVVMAAARPLRARPGHLRAELRFRCDARGALEVVNDAFFDLAPSHVHFARLTGSPGGAVEHLFTDVQRRRVLLDPEGELADPPGASFAGYLGLGVEHILVGYDHIAFLIALLLLGGRVRDVLWVVTGFTLGHSLTLSLAVLGLVRVDAGLVEALIGFSIALVAAENLSLRAGWNLGLAGASAAALAALAVLSGWAGIGPPWVTLAGLALFCLCYLRLAATAEATRRIRPMLTMLFGLVHGFGFATVLMEIGIPRERLLAGLLGFNVGVEIGQVAVVLLVGVGAWAGRRLFSRLDPWLVADGLSAALCALGIFWFVERAYG
jgi:hypothetical protein